MINQGSYYTNKKITDIVFKIVKKHIQNYKQFTLLDTSCGYGSFLLDDNFYKKIGADIDEKSLEKCPQNCLLFHCNSLFNVSRKMYSLTDHEKLLVVGNPPYNDITSQTHQEIKTNKLEIDDELKSRDLGISFMKSYDKLQADYVCILHPLSYLIKKTNFNSLKQFSKNYHLITGEIISSSQFEGTSKVSTFPILIALYKRGNGMTWEDIVDHEFIVGDKTFSLKNFDFIGSHIQKYPNQNNVCPEDAVAIFYTMRDINALKRSKTFMDKIITNSILVTLDKLPLYCYVDIFKDYCSKLPYYYGNIDVFINYEKWDKIKTSFNTLSAKKHPNLLKKLEIIDETTAKNNVEIYFSELFS